MRNMIRTKHRVSLLLLLSALPALAGDTRYRVSAVTFAASSVADIVSSYGSPEGNPRMASVDGTLGKRGIVMKAISTTGLFVSQYVAHKIAKDKRKALRLCTVVNFALAGVGGVVTARNVRIDK